MTIEAAGESDREWCARLMASSEPWITLRRGLKATKASLRLPGRELFIARKGKRRLGFILLEARGVAGSPYITSIAIASRQRGRGVGSQLIVFAEKHFAGSKHLFLCVSSFNRRAQNLYRRLGYEPVAEFPDYIVDGHSEVLMHKRLR